MKRAYIILTDSGGVQEEAPALGKPVLVLRNETERPEGIETGVVQLVGIEYEKIVKKIFTLLRSDQEYKKMAKGVSPYGDGHASERITRILINSIV
jgi:UDP-N-acetylglucosamine 2-epimerase (non-hydrolysing)